MDARTDELFRMMGEPFKGETLIQDGWVYRDPNKMLSVLWTEFLNIMGEGNYRLMSHARYQIDGKQYERGQMMVSPQGMDNLTAHLKSKAH